MPAPALKALASKAGVSLANAEKLWKKAKDAAKGSELKSGGKVPDNESKWTDKHYAYVTGIFKKMLGSKQESLSEAIVGYAVTTGNGNSIIEALSKSDIRVRAFFDSGELCFSDMEDIQLTSEDDERVAIISGIVNEVEWPVDHPIYDEVDGYEGSLHRLFKTVLSTAKVVPALEND